MGIFSLETPKEKLPDQPLLESFLDPSCPNNKPVRINSGRNRFIIAIVDVIRDHAL